MEAVKRFWEKIQDDEVFSKASSLSYMTVFASIPALSLVFFLFAQFSAFSGMYEKIKNFIFTYFIPQSGMMIEEKLDELLKNIGSLEVIGVIALIVTTVLMVDFVEGNINKIWGIRQKRALLVKIASYWAFITLVPILIALSIYISTRLASFGFFTTLKESPVFRSIQYILLPFLITVIAFFIVYFILPNGEVNPLAALGGAVFGAFLWEISKLLFDVYIIYFSTIPRFYGTLGNILVFIFWIYLSWTFLLLGAEVAVFLEGDPGAQITPSLLFVIMLLTYKKYEQGEPSKVMEIAKHLELNMTKVRYAYRILESSALVVEIKKSHYVPIKLPDKASIKELLSTLNVVNFKTNGMFKGEFKALEFVKEKMETGLQNITVKEVLPLVPEL
ncbi:MAG TPA: YihY family inner membrane protein [Candidatus Hydrothermia bacterium]|nr:YihY family inner membrane protein [Candidatus Hydrothermia bacterium]MDD5573129.1 YihY family inner membrane protein [Candidatus Hydrothermia bacterium]HOK23468.1 YihY family inner membrane protein [Candidatus Hydrothermia bacterium]HOL24010.1 YihY family inner membrane protein [Candidatus Hydrothermia bacterium]HOP32771.1 YihY family inner membrane protein [Candidatus Hydrothermia bacterium]